MMREIVKDIEDIEGDFSTGLVTLPIRYGKEIAKKIALLFGVGTLMVIAYFLYPKRYDEVGFYYVLSIGIVLFLIGIISMLFIYKAQTKKDYSRSSLFLKIWMLVGVLSMCFIPKFV
jgi:4-hydroxybenzoate polyprenyltransferase